MGRRVVGGGLCEIFLTDLDPGCVAGEYELSRCVGLKSWQGLKVEKWLKNSIFSEGGYP